MFPQNRKYFRGFLQFVELRKDSVVDVDKVYIDGPSLLIKVNILLSVAATKRWE